MRCAIGVATVLVTAGCSGADVSLVVVGGGDAGDPGPTVGAPLADAAPDVARDASPDGGLPLDAAADVADAADSSPAPCTDASTPSDPMNCGRCGHSCQGGACVAGECRPVAVASVAGPSALALDASNVYWTTGDGSVQRCPKSGCVAPSALSSTRAPYGLAVDSSSVYWTSATGGSGSAIESCPVGGGVEVPLATTTQSNTFREVVTVANALVWTGSNAGVFACTPANCVATTATLDTSGAQAMGLATDGANVYWSRGNRIVRCAVAGCGGQPTVIVDNVGALEVAVDAAFVYWLSGDGSVNRCELAGCVTPVQLAKIPATPQGIAVDSTGVYWADPQNGRVLSCSTTGCGGVPRVVAGAQSVPSFVRLDASTVYWMNAANPGGAIMKIAK